MTYLLTLNVRRAPDSVMERTLEYLVLRPGAVVDAADGPCIADVTVGVA